MNILIITQVYFPDTVSVSQHLTDFAERLASKGHSVEVISSRYGYDSNDSYLKKAQEKNVYISRISHTNYNKNYFLFRALNFLTFNLAIFFNLLRVSRSVDLVIGTTVPPFSALIECTLKSGPIK